MNIVTVLEQSLSMFAVKRIREKRKKNCKNKPRVAIYSSGRISWYSSYIIILGKAYWEPIDNISTFPLFPLSLIYRKYLKETDKIPSVGSKAWAYYIIFITSYFKSLSHDFSDVIPFLSLKLESLALVTDCFPILTCGDKLF